MVNLNLHVSSNKFEYEATIPVSEEDVKNIDGYDLGYLVKEYIYKLIKEDNNEKE